MRIGPGGREGRICGRSNWHMDMRNDPLQEPSFKVKVHTQSRFNSGATFQIELGAANLSPPVSLPAFPL